MVRHKHTLLHITENLTSAAEKWMREDMEKRRKKDESRMKSYVEKPSCDTSDEGVEISASNPLQSDSLSTQTCLQQ